MDCPLREPGAYTYHVEAPSSGSSHSLVLLLNPAFLCSENSARPDSLSPAAFAISFLARPQRRVRSADTRCRAVLETRRGASINRRVVAYRRECRSAAQQHGLDSTRDQTSIFHVNRRFGD